MRHRVYGKHLSRSKNERTSLFRGLIRSLVLEGSITTTEAKAKAIKPFVDKLVTAGRKNSPASKRLVEMAVVQAEVIKKLMEEITPSFKDRTSGFTRTVRLGQRLGDRAMMVKMSWSSGSKQKTEDSQQVEEVKSQNAKVKNTIKKSKVEKKEEESES